MKPVTTIAKPDGSYAHWCNVHESYLKPTAFYPSDIRAGQRICIECRTTRRQNACRKRRLLSNFKQTAKRQGVASVARWELGDIAHLLAEFSDEELKARCLQPKDPTANDWTPGELVVVLRSQAVRIRKQKVASGGTSLTSHSIDAALPLWGQPRRVVLSGV